MHVPPQAHTFSEACRALAKDVSVENKSQKLAASDPWDLRLMLGSACPRGLLYDPYVVRSSTGTALGAAFSGDASGAFFWNEGA